MRTPSLRKPSPSLVVSVAALVVALGGTSYAAVKVSGAQIVDGTVTAKDVKQNSLGSGVIRDGSLKAQDFRKLPTGPAGADGQDGQDGQDGARGPAGVGRWALVDTSGAIVAQSGGFTVVSRYDVDPTTPAGAVGNVYIDAGEDLADNGILATLALQNTVDQNADGITNGRSANPDANPEFSGEVTVSRCAFPGSTGIPTNCAPLVARTATSFVVSPRLSDGQVTDATNRKAFYVVVTGDSSDLVATP
ncbi:hypothetical protein [Nocardioides sp. SYSU D00038]|uniref:hypothetical protein n=1 Tax=Nocardioides sp. SYSU D00038 TaxID=2812554 RepID=UPI001966F1FA|nr:hypothetical protein [Nocardioides sp. SYSU D00038]